MDVEQVEDVRAYAGSMAAQADRVEVDSAPLVSASLRLAEERERLMDAVNVLEQRLGRVLRPESEMKVPSLPDPVREEPWRFGDVFAEEARLVRQAAARLQGLVDRLEL